LTTNGKVFFFVFFVFSGRDAGKHLWRAKNADLAGDQRDLKKIFGNLTKLCNVSARRDSL